jgi:beta-galactosidase
MARGCESLFYFRYRGFTKGAEQFCQGILDADNQINEKYKEVQSFFSWSKEHVDLWKSTIINEVALLYDYDNRWSWHGQRQTSGFDYTNEILRCYRPFYARNTGIDVIDFNKEFSHYKILIIPVLQLISKELEEKLKTYAKNGGIILFSYRTAIKDSENNLLFGEKAPCYLNDLVGATVKNYESLGEDRRLNIIQDDRIVGQAGVWRDLLSPTTATSLLDYEAPFNAYSACTKNSFGKGLVYYVATGLDQVLMKQVVDDLLHESLVVSIETPVGLEVVLRTCNDEKTYLVMNHNHENITWRGLVIKALEVMVLSELPLAEGAE